jgi:hypothetical protein
MVASTTPELCVYHIWEYNMHPEWKSYFEKGEKLLEEAKNDQFYSEDFLNFFRDRGLRLSIEEETPDGRLLRLLTARLLIVYANMVWDIEMEYEHADECLKKLTSAEYIGTIIRCWLLNHHCDKYFPALGWLTEEERNEIGEIFRSRIFRSNYFIQPIDANAQSVAPLPFDQLFRDR